MDIGLFTYITGIATLLGVVLQFRDVFPEHRELRKAVVLVIIGVFVGTVLGALQRVNVTVAAPLTWFPVLVAALLLILFIIIVSALFAQEKERRKALYITFGWLLAAILLVLVIAPLVTRDFQRKLSHYRQTNFLFWLTQMCQKGIMMRRFDGLSAFGTESAGKTHVLNRQPKESMNSNENSLSSHSHPSTSSSRFENFV